jgi:tetratricopeptide (TPR) repeat protein
LRQAGKATSDDVNDFCRLVRDRVRDYPTIRKRALLIVGQVAEEFNQPESQMETLALLEFASELSEGYVEPAMGTSITLQAAELAGYLRDAVKARHYLGKAGEWIDKAKSLESARREQRSWSNLRVNYLATKGRILIRLAENAATGDQSAEDAFSEAFDVLKEAQEFMHDRGAELWGDIELFLADVNWWYGLAASHLNRFDEAVKLFRAARSEVAMAHPRFAAEVGMRAWLHEVEALTLAGRIEEGSKAVATLLADSRATDAVRRRAEKLQKYIERTLRPVIEWFGSPEAKAVAEASKENTLREAVAKQVALLVAWWTQWHGVGGASEPKPLHHLGKVGEIESLVLDFWGRGGFSRLAVVIRAKPHNAIAVDARSTADISRWARMLCPLFDTVIIKWKGELGELLFCDRAEVCTG